MHKCKITRQWIGLAGELSGMIVYHHGSCTVYGRQPFKHRSSWDSKCRIPVARLAWRSSKIRIAFSVWSEQTGKQKDGFECSRFISVAVTNARTKSNVGEERVNITYRSQATIGGNQDRNSKGNLKKKMLFVGCNRCPLLSSWLLLESTKIQQLDTPVKDFLDWILELRSPTLNLDHLMT